MAKFIYRGRAADGGSVRGELEATDEDAVLAALRARGVLVTSLEPAASRDIRVRNRDLVVFTRQFATMLSAGLPLVQTLGTLAEQSPEGLAEIAVDVRRQIEAGQPLSAALERYPRTFNRLYCALVRAGEISGNLEVIFERLAGYLERSDALRRRVRSAVAYPMVVLTMVVLLGLGFMLFIIPLFSGIFDAFGGDLPLPTRIVVGLSEFLQTYWYIPLLLVLVVWAFFKFYGRTAEGRYSLDRLKLRLPIFGKLMTRVSVARFSRTLGTLVRSGVPIMDGLAITAATVGNRVLEDAVRETRRQVGEGRTFAEPLAETEIFPPMVTAMIAVGERTGRLEEMLNKVADFYDDEVRTSVEGLSSLLEPILMIIMGLVVGGLVVSMYLPIFQMPGVIGG
ncbi:MAG: type II secretion system F family protein [Candidatus Coatesbacteria bacterium]|nr:type II secretion system F family protein [Candidatus Coatesbacteria bacterium]